MLNNGNKQECVFADEIVSYIYDEIGAAERWKFETHLPGCGVCTDEFADVSNARFSVFEWHKEEFAHLATPEIIILYAAKQRVADENTTVGFLAGLRGLLSVSRWPISVAAAVLVCLGAGFLVMNYVSRGDQQIAVNAKVNEQSVPPVVTPESAVRVQSPEILTANVPDTPETGASKNTAASREARRVNASENRRPKPERQLTATTQRNVDNSLGQIASPQKRKAPVLTNYDDSDDKSLRLADLFDDEIGSIR